MAAAESPPLGLGLRFHAALVPGQGVVRVSVRFPSGSPCAPAASTKAAVPGQGRLQTVKFHRGGGKLLHKLAGLGIAGLPVDHALPGGGHHQLLPGPCDAHVAESALLLDLRLVVRSDGHHARK